MQETLPRIYNLPGMSTSHIPKTIPRHIPKPWLQCNSEKEKRIKCELWRTCTEFFVEEDIVQLSLLQMYTVAKPTESEKEIPRWKILYILRLLHTP